MRAREFNKYAASGFVYLKQNSADSLTGAETLSRNLLVVRHDSGYATQINIEVTALKTLYVSGDNVASFLTKDLIIDWRWGEKYFMQKLVDGDLSSNNGGWQWSASSGMDPKPLRIFNPASQAKKYDPDAEYIRQWLPEIRHLNTSLLVSGDIDPLALEGTGYPTKIVDHKEQQAIFKERYKAQKK